MIKKHVLIVAVLQCSVLSGLGQGAESFALSSATPSYNNGSYIGDNGVTWSYTASRNTEAGVNSTAINLPGLMLRRVSDDSKVISSPVSGGIGNFSVKLYKGFTGAGNRQVELFINNISQGQSIPFDDYDEHIFSVHTINITGDVRIEIRNITANQVIIDDISWTAASTATVDYCDLQSPQNGNITPNTAFNVYAQVYEAGVTEIPGPHPEISAWIGYNTINNNPNHSGWIWLPATYNINSGNNHEYRADIGSGLSSGTYYYASRFQIDGGPFSYGGYNTSGGGFWDGISNISGVLSIDTVDFCNLQHPRLGTINLGDPFDVYGQVYETGITPGAGQGSGIVAEIVYSTTNSNPNTWTNWISAIYNTTCGDCYSGQNDEYSTDLGSAITTPGTYFYATRFSLNGGIWRYGGILADGSFGNFWDGVTYVSGELLVEGPKIRVEGNVGTFPNIVNGDTTPQGTDGTLFAAQYIGASQSKSYRIRNIGNLALELSNVSIIGAHPDDFTITTITSDTTLLPETFSILEIEFSPLAAGIRNAIVSISSNDSEANPYTFAIRGTGLCVATSTVINPLNGPTGTIATLIGTNFDSSTFGSINGIPMATTFINANTIEVTIPENAATGHINVENTLGCTSTTPFTIIDSQMGGCEGVPSLSDLFISEITDATVGGLSYIEIYNGTGRTINLQGYSIAIYSNGAATANSTFPLDSFLLENNAVFVLAISPATTPTASNTCPQAGGNGQFANQTSNARGINKKDNEHDAIRLLKSGGTEVVDQFGVYMDKTWMDATIITGDRGFNFRRLNTAPQLPNPNFDLNDWTIIDWVDSGPGSCHTNDYSDIGMYDYSGGNPPAISIQPLALSTYCALTAILNVSGTEGVDGGNPLAYQWYYNAADSSNWVEILASNPDYSGQQSSSLNILSTLLLDGYQYYAQVRENTVTCYKASNSVRINVNTTTWDGFNWNPTAPNSNSAVILNGNYNTSTTNASFTACSLFINAGYTLNITNSYFVEILNDVIVSGNLIVETNGAFVQRGDGYEAGTFTLKNSGTSRVNKSTAPKQNWYDYTYWSSPVINETVESVLSLAPSSRRFYFEAANYEDTNGDDVDDNGDDWQLATGRMIPGVGYASTSNNSGIFPRVDTTVFEGAFNTGDCAVTIHTNSLPTDKDWNFIGNPYASAIDFKMVYNENTNVIAGAAYLWSQASPPLASNPGNQALNFNGADYAIITIGSGNIAGGTEEIPSDFIPSAQAFFVIGNENGGTLTFKNSMRMADANSNSQFFRTPPSNLPNKFWINLNSDNGAFNQILVAYVDGATDGVDGFAYDTERNLSSGLNAILYTRIPDSHKKYAIQGKAIQSLTLDEEVLIGFKTSIAQPTIYKLSIAQIQGLFFAEYPVFIKDVLLNSHHNLSVSDYHFTSAIGEFNDRFVIVFKNETLTTTDANLDAKHLSIIERSNGHIQFSVAPHLSITAVEIIDVLGRSLYHATGNNAIETYDLSHLYQTAYIAKVKLSNGQTIIKRAVKRY